LGVSIIRRDFKNIRKKGSFLVPVGPKELKTIGLETPVKG